MTAKDVTLLLVIYYQTRSQLKTNLKDIRQKTRTITEKVRQILGKDYFVTCLELNLAKQWEYSVQD